MKKIVLKLYEFDELSKDSQERIIEREHWNVMEQCMDAYGIDYKKSMKAFEDMTDTRVYNWEVGYERYDFSYEFKYKDPIYEHPTDYHRDIFPEEAQEIDDFVKHADGCPVGVDWGTEGFYSYNDANAIGGTCVDVIFSKYNQ